MFEEEHSLHSNPVEKAALEEKRRYLAERNRRRTYIEDDINKRGIHVVLADIVEDPSLYRYRCLIGETRHD